MQCAALDVYVFFSVFISAKVTKYWHWNIYVDILPVRIDTINDEVFLQGQKEVQIMK